MDFQKGKVKMALTFSYSVPAKDALASKGKKRMTKKEGKGPRRV
jgi:hypothetical protein